jgi:transposase-like protein
MIMVAVRRYLGRGLMPLWMSSKEMYLKVVGAAARRFFIRALEHDRCPTEVTTDQALAYPRVIEEPTAAACHVTKLYTNSPGEADH